MTFYAHFRNMDELVDACVRSIFLEASAAMAMPFVDGSANQAVIRNLRAFVKKCQEYYSFFAWVAASSRQVRVHQLFFEGMRIVFEERISRFKPQASTEIVDFFTSYEAAGSARLLMEFVLRHSEANESSLDTFLAVLARLWLPSAYTLLGIPEGQQRIERD